MKNNYPYFQQILLLFLLVFLASGFVINKNGKNKLKTPPVFKTGTFWKGLNTQLTDYTGKVINPTSPTHSTCDVVGEIIYKGKTVYEAIFTIPEEGKKWKMFIQKKNINPLFAVGIEEKDTMLIDFELLNFPLQKGKKWNSVCVAQEYPGQPIQKINTSFEIVSIKDSILNVKEQEIKTKAFRIKARSLEENGKLESHYIYLAPKGKFPGTCPIFMWNQFKKNAKRAGSKSVVRRSFELLEYKW